MNSTPTLATSNSNQPLDHAKCNQKLIWNISVGLSSFCSALVLYFSVTVIVFICKQAAHKTPQWTTKSQNSVSSRRTVLLPDITVDSSSVLHHHVSTQKSRANKKLARYKKLLHFILFVVVLLILVRAVLEAALLHFGNTSDQLCDIFSKVVIVSSAVTIYGVHCFLWMRQQVISTNPILKETRPRFVHYVSYITYVFMILVLIGCIVILLFWSDYHVMDDICQRDIESERFSVAIPFGILSVSTAIIQFLLSFLFVYPIVRNNRKLKAHKGRKRAKIYVRPSDRNAEKSWSVLREKSEILNKTVKRSLLCSTIIVTTDFMSAAVAIWFHSNIPRATLSAIYHLNMVLNIVCLFYTYGEWKKFFVPCI